MKRKIATILSCLLAVSGLTLSGGVFLTSAKAEESSHTERLFLPASYEQYLPLEDPTDVAVTSDRIAVRTVRMYTFILGQPMNTSAIPTTKTSTNCNFQVVPCIFSIRV